MHEFFSFNFPLREYFCTLHATAMLRPPIPMLLPLVKLNIVLRYWDPSCGTAGSTLLMHSSS